MIEIMENLNFTELTSSEMKQVKGGNWLDDLLKVIDALGIEAAAASVGMTVQQLRDLLGL
jgi:hypothetical protein